MLPIILLNEDRVSKGVSFFEDGYMEMDAAGGEVLLPELITSDERYFTFTLELMEKHSGTFQLMFFAEGEAQPRFSIRFGVLPELETRFCFDMEWLDGHTLFPGNTPGALKVVCHGARIGKDELSKVVFSNHPCFHNIKVRLGGLELTDEIPQFPVPEKIMVDRFGQTKCKDWVGKIQNEAELKQRLDELFREEAHESSSKQGFKNRSVYGGCTAKSLKAGTGYFSSVKKDGRWYLVDPLGYAFFSQGPDCVAPHNFGRIDGMEKLLEWMPQEDSEEYRLFVRHDKPRFSDIGRPEMKSVSFTGVNLYRVWGEKWYESWSALVERQLLLNGMNTLGNWSDDKLFGKIRIPYVTSLPEFPDTKTHIFRDFPDVLSEEYQKDAERCAAALEMKKNDPLMIGYFLRNEPTWAFVNNLVIADEVLYNPENTVCKRLLIEYLQKKYKSIVKLNEAYRLNLLSFEDLNTPLANVSKLSKHANEDMRAFSRKMLTAYVEIPSKACRTVDPNHMNLGMRWCWISDPDLISGWENFDVFSINCYATDPTEQIENIRRLGVDLPVIIGEFHFGALDAGPTATGLEGVETQKDRGKAYKYFCQRVAAHPFGVGCHYFQFYDQFPLGRFDGENYNIGMFDICSQPYEDMMAYVRECSETVYDVMDGSRLPTDEKGKSIPMIAY